MKHEPKQNTKVQKQLTMFMVYQTLIHVSLLRIAYVCLCVYMLCVVVAVDVDCVMMWCVFVCVLLSLLLLLVCVCVWFGGGRTWKHMLHAFSPSAVADRSSNAYNKRKTHTHWAA